MPVSFNNFSLFKSKVECLHFYVSSVVCKVGCNHTYPYQLSATVFYLFLSVLQHILYITLISHCMACGFVSGSLILSVCVSLHMSATWWGVISWTNLSGTQLLLLQEAAKAKLSRPCWIFPSVSKLALWTLCKWQSVPWVQHLYLWLLKLCPVVFGWIGEAVSYQKKTILVIASHSPVIIIETESCRVTVSDWSDWINGLPLIQRLFWEELVFLHLFQLFHWFHSCYSVVWGRFSQEFDINKIEFSSDPLTMRFHHLGCCSSFPAGGSYF